MSDSGYNATDDALVKPPCTRCYHSPDDHRISSDAEIQDPTDERTRFRCVTVGCDCPNYERWTRP